MAKKAKVAKMATFFEIPPGTRTPSLPLGVRPCPAGGRADNRRIRLLSRPAGVPPSRRVRMARLGLSALLAVLGTLPAAAQPINRADLKPGLVFTEDTVAYGAKQFTFSRIEPTVALNLAAGEAPHPRSAGGIFHWRGYINILQPGKYRFDAVVAGALGVEVAGKEVLSAVVRGELKRVDGPVVELAAGFQPFEVTLLRLGDKGPARLELIWRGPGFRPEPVPYFVLGHLPKQRPASFAADRAREHGRFLFEELACVRCHKPDTADKMAKTLAERTGPDLTEIGKRAYPGWLDAWLADPHRLRPDTTMPRLFADDAKGRAERYAVVAYLASLGGPMPGPRRSSFGDAQRSTANGQRLFVTTGCAACHGDKLTQPPAKKDDPDEDDKPPPFKPEDSAYAAGTAGPRSLYRLGAPGSKTTPEALAKYLQDPLATNPHGRMPNMSLSDQEAQDLARYLCRQTDEAVGRELPDEPKLKPADVVAPGETVVERWRFARMKRSDQWRDVGKKLFTGKGCANCHTVALPDSSQPGERGDEFVRPPQVRRAERLPRRETGRGQGAGLRARRRAAGGARRVPEGRAERRRQPGPGVPGPAGAETVRLPELP
jgi:mono/diheme cytochrome c family protein